MSSILAKILGQMAKWITVRKSVGLMPAALRRPLETILLRGALT